MNKYLEFEENPKGYYTIKEGNVVIGGITFSPYYSEFAFYTLIGTGFSINNSMIKEIASFLDKLNKEHKEEK